MNGKPTTIGHAELLERKANIARRRLMNTVDELEARKNAFEHEASLLLVAALAVGALVFMAWAGGRLRTWHERRRVLRALHLR